jgi:hypothetical protein
MQRALERPVLRQSVNPRPRVCIPDTFSLYSSVTGDITPGTPLFSPRASKDTASIRMEAVTTGTVLLLLQFWMRRA